MTTNNKKGENITKASALICLLLATAQLIDFGEGNTVSILINSIPVVEYSTIIG